MNTVTDALPSREYPDLKPYQSRVLNFNPVKVYERIDGKIDHHKRTQSVSVMKMFPTEIAGVCPCGCLQVITDKRRRYATEDCALFTNAVWAIINNWSGAVGRWLRRYHGGWTCQDCGCEDEGHVFKNSGIIVSNIKIDHIVSVKYGGGGCWLANYQLLCHQCHVKKTNKDFGHHGAKPAENQPLLNFGPDSISLSDNN